MSANTVVGDGELAAAVKGILDGYEANVAKGINKAVNTVAKEFLERTKADAPKRTGAYVRSMALRTDNDVVGGSVKLWYVRPPLYRLPHLLERPHKLSRRGRTYGTTKAHPHIYQNEQWAIKELERRTEEVIKSAGN